MIRLALSPVTECYPAHHRQSNEPIFRCGNKECESILHLTVEHWVELEMKGATEVDCGCCNHSTELIQVGNYQYAPNRTMPPGARAKIMRALFA